VLIVHLPSFLRKHLRLWVRACGPVRSIIHYPKDEGDSYTTSSNPQNAKEEDEQQPQNVTASLVIMNHADSAIRLICAIRHIADSLPVEFRAYLVPVAPDIPLPPPVLDEETTRSLGERMIQTYHELEVGIIHDDIETYNYINAVATNSSNLLDGNKEGDALATGGDDEDPLSAPEVVEAVKEFRRRLEQTQSVQKRRRVALVQERIQQLLPFMRQRMEEEHQQQQHQAMFPPPVAFPPPPPLPPQMPPGFLPPPPPPPLDSAMMGGPRGVSNMPAWMTNRPPEDMLPPPPPPPPLEGIDSGLPPSLKRIKVEDEGDSLPQESAGLAPSAKRIKLQDATTFAGMVVSPSQYPIVREWISSMIQEYLGEEEVTLIDFVHKHVIQGKAVKELHEELKQVLEEDATAFCERLLTKLQTEL
jgi:hypothetical protein